MVNPYQYQPAMTWTHPSAFINACSSKNYSHAAGERCIPAPRAFKLAEEKLGKLFNRRMSVSGDSERQQGVEEGEVRANEKAKEENMLKDAKTTH